jgi:hypothetical protein
MNKDHPYWPLIASLLTLPWTMMVFAGLLLAAWGRQYQHAPRSVLDFGFIALVPAIAGLVFGIMLLVRGAARTTAQQTWVWIGTVLCGLWCYGLTDFLIH